MKNALILALATAGAYLIGRGKAQKARSTTELLIDVKCDTQQALAALAELEKKATATHASVTVKGADIAAVLDLHNYRQRRTN